jgi:hypothetical protein
VAFTKTTIAKGSKVTVELTITPRQMAVLHNASTTVSHYLDDAWANESMIPPTWVIEPLTLKLSVGGQQPDQIVAAPSNVLSASVKIVGQPKAVHECHAGSHPHEASFY